MNFLSNYYYNIKKYISLLARITMIEKIFRKANENSASTIAYRRHLHENPEVEFDLNNTVEYIERCLREIGLYPERVGRSGVCAIIGDRTKPAVLLRADMDALPIEEKTGLEYCSTNGKMHACGHDMHTAMLLGAAKIITEYSDELKCCVKLLFQPAEEILSGAKDCIDSKILENPKVQYAFMLHVMTAVPMPCGTVVIGSDGVGAPAASFFKIIIKGKSAHGASPSGGADAIRVGSKIVNELYDSDISQNRNCVISVGKIGGGTAPNVISDICAVQGSIRAFSNEEIEEIKHFIEITSGRISEEHGAKVSIEYTAECPPLLNNGYFSERIYTGLKSKLKNIYTTDELSNGKKTIGGSEDFAYFSQLVPSVMAAVCAGSSEDGYTAPLHNPKTVFDEKALCIGAGVYASVPFLI